MFIISLHYDARNNLQGKNTRQEAIAGIHWEELLPELDSGMKIERDQLILRKNLIWLLETKKKKDSVMTSDLLA